MQSYRLFMRRLVRNYMIGSAVAVMGVGSILIFSTLKISAYDARLLLLTLVISIPFMIISESAVFRRHMRPIRWLFDEHHTASAQDYQTAFLQLHRLPILAVRRVALPHWLGLAGPAVSLTLIEILYFHLTIPLSYLVVAIIGSILVASMHALIEFFLTAEAIVPMLSEVQEMARTALGMHLTLDGKVLVSVQSKYRSSALLIGVFPLILFSLATQLRLNQGLKTMQPSAYWQWAGVILLVGIGFSILSSGLLARVVQRPIVELESKMAKVQRGNLQTRAIEAYSDEFSRLVTGFNLMVDDLQARELQTMLLTQSLLTTLAAALDARDPYTAGHSQRVSDYSVEIGKRAGLTATVLKDLRESALLHDIGKIGIPDTILLKEGRLSAEEFEVMKSHPVVGESILLQVQPPNAMAALLPGVRSHHERYDGDGYPDGLSGEQIPLFGRIMAIADAFDAMTSDRPYRRGMPAEKAISILREGRGTQWDPIFTDLFIDWANQHLLAGERPSAAAATVPIAAATESP
ncbi:MAG: HD domain-containing protein [Alicyclobacillaceae bacterium]|nr:HD domain-containing protein [Alicyclobacillaceae bacterium]